MIRHSTVRGALVALGFTAGFALLAPALDRHRGSDALEIAPVRRIPDGPYVGVNDLARLLRATKFWRADVRKLVLRAGAHRIQLVVDSPFILVDSRVRLLPSPVRSLGGEIHVPVAIVEEIPRDPDLARLLYDARRAAVRVVPPEGVVRSPTVAVDSSATRVIFPADRVDDVRVVSRSRAHFRVRFGGLFAGVLPESAPYGSLILGVRPIPSAEGSAFEFVVAQEAQGFRLIPDPNHKTVSVEFWRARRERLDRFAAERAPGVVRVVVIDPGHGGEDHGVVAAGVVEKDMTLALARALRDELLRRTAAEVLLTRDGDRAMSAEQRAEMANGARADLFLSLHFDGFGGERARGATAWFVPASGEPLDERRAGPLRILPWRDVGTRHAVQSRMIADAVVSALELRGLGPARFRERLPSALIGVDAPGVMLECATLTSSVDRGRLSRAEGVQALAATIAEAVVAYQGNE